MKTPLAAGLTCVNLVRAGLGGGWLEGQELLIQRGPVHQPEKFDRADGGATASDVLSLPLLEYPQNPGKLLTVLVVEEGHPVGVFKRQFHRGVDGTCQSHKHLEISSASWELLTKEVEGIFSRGLFERTPGEAVQFELHGQAENDDAQRVGILCRVEHQAQSALEVFVHGLPFRVEELSNELMTKIPSEYRIVKIRYDSCRLTFYNRANV